MTAPAVTPDPQPEPVKLNDWKQVSFAPSPERPTLGDLLVELLAAFTTSNANAEQLATRVEALESRMAGECPCNNDVFGEGPCRECRQAFAKRES